MLISGLIVTFFLWAMQEEIADFFPIVSIIMTWGFGLSTVANIILGLMLLNHSLSVDIGFTGVKIKHRLFGYSFGEEITASEIADIFVKKTGSSTNGKTTRVWYSLKLIKKDGSSATVGDTLEGNSHAERVRQQMLQNLGDKWSATEVNESKTQLRKGIPPWWLKYVKKLISLAFYGDLIYYFRDIFINLFEVAQTLFA